MEILINFSENFLSLANAMSPYILIGLLIAGFLKELLPTDFIFRHLGKSSFSSVIKATILGIPMPVCSCSVIPLAKSLQKEGASKGAVSSFLISTPITGIDSILATYSFFGLFFTLYRVITSMIIAIIAGILQNLFSYKKKVKRFSLSPINIKQGSNLLKQNQKLNFSSTSCCNGECTTTSSSHKKDGFSIKRVLNYSLNTLFGDISKSLLIGLLLGAVFSTFLPTELLSKSYENLFLSYTLIVLISIPMYICATSSLPIGASLLLGGVPIGAVFVFLSAEPATNSVTISVVKDMFGKIGLTIYLSTITIFSILFGYFLDRVSIDFKIFEYATSSLHNGVIEYFTTAIMFSLMFYLFLKKRDKRVKIKG